MFAKGSRCREFMGSELEGGEGKRREPQTMGWDGLPQCQGSVLYSQALRHGFSSIAPIAARSAGLFINVYHLASRMPLICRL